jgi:hypothetical protein
MTRAEVLRELTYDWLRCKITWFDKRRKSGKCWARLVSGSDGILVKFERDSLGEVVDPVSIERLRIHG